jgi:molybdopterin-binding protein
MAGGGAGSGWGMRISARNQLTGTVTEIHHGAVTTTVKVALAGGDTITSSITKEAAEDLGLAEGSEVTVVVKASDVLLATDS